MWDILGQLAISKYHPYPNLRANGLWSKEVLIKGLFWPGLRNLGALFAGPGS